MSLQRTILFHLVQACASFHCKHTVSVRNCESNKHTSGISLGKNSARTEVAASASKAIGATALRMSMWYRLVDFGSGHCGGPILKSAGVDIMRKPRYTTVYVMRLQEVSTMYKRG